MFYSQRKDIGNGLIKFIYIIIFFILLSFVVLRPLNHDETYYLISSKAMLLEGKTPYVDFIFHQMPLIIFAYMPVSVLGYWSLPAGRILSCLFLIASYFILLKTFKSKFNGRQVFLFTILFWFNMFLIDWAVTVKIYSLSILLISTGIYFYSRYLDKFSDWRHLFLSSLCFSMLVLTKIAFTANYLVLVIYTIYYFYSNKGDRKITYVIGSLLTPIIFCVIFFFILFGTNFERLYFNLFEINIIYKYLTSFSEDVLIYALFFILPQNFIILFLMLFSLYNLDKVKIFLLLNIVAFLIINLTTRLLMEYNTSILPLMIILAVFGFENFMHQLKKILRNVSSLKFAIVLLIIYCISSPFSIYHIKQFISSGKLPLNPVELYYFNKKIDSLKGETVLSSWEGLSVFSSKRTLFKENYAISYVSDFIDKETKAKYNLFIREDYRKLVDDHVADIIIFDSANGAQLSGLDDNIRINYKEAFEYNYITVFIRK